MRGAEHYLVNAAFLHCPYLLNDNVHLQGPWFDSIEWLEQAWLPHARRIGLRYMAHVVQADTRVDILTRTFLQPVIGTIDLQLFHTVAEAEDWLRTCQQRS